MGATCSANMDRNPRFATMPILVGLDGVNKMSKSLGNYIGLRKSQVNVRENMSMADELMPDYYRLATDYTPEEVDAVWGHKNGSSSPDAKCVWRRIVELYHGREAAEKRKKSSKLFLEIKNCRATFRA